ncbi:MULTISPECIES: ferrochelatase [unclassified Neptuniibacter]|uniref:ferrochelatase n=1 Tax=unclassified Neptuniibacter TaxID=2630693 RepID=UPI000C3F5B02|nr:MULTISPECIES: ferrochelatase [unclassified Neptuniibacter]MAY41736.1 ferrochelatase [Oceanospirillaceae bacterium]|tara:strand:- start:702 stop:1712 length:1011 start_codon:yes stop_codon:yes gene_type:complete
MSQSGKAAVVLVNLGTPDKAEPGAVRRFLKEFLSDQRVVEGKGLRRLLWLSVLNGIVLNIRPKKVAKAYASIWEDDSPMRKILDKQVAELHLLLQQQYGDHAPDVFSAMTYGKPGLSQRLEKLSSSGYQKILLVPMYPQYSATTTAPIYDLVARYQLKQRSVLDIRIVNSYYDHPAYIAALAGQIQEFRDEQGKADKLILSYHGIPKEYADKGDPYPEQCHQTSVLLAGKMGMADTEWMTTFQSRFGPAQWMEPYTDKTLEALPAKGVKNIHIVCPAFSADCLETLEEIAIENREVFLEAGGDSYDYIPALNAQASFIDLLAALVKEQAGDWVGER